MVSRKVQEHRDALARAMTKLQSISTANRRADAMLRATERPRNDPEAFGLGSGMSRAPRKYLEALQAEQQRGYGQAPTVPTKAAKDLQWHDFTFGNLDAEDTEDADRLEYWFQQWTTPTGSDGYGSNVTSQRIFFAILAANGVRRTDYDWDRFRQMYFSLNKGQYPLFKAEQDKRRKKK